MCQGFSNLNVQSEPGWTVLHCAAAYGSAQDIKQLMACGADLSINTYEEGWTPIFCAAAYDNPSAFKELALSMQSNLVTAVDFRGWTLLHVAARSGSSDVIAALLEAGADPHCSSFPSHIPDSVSLSGRSLTPAEVAAIQGEETLGRLNEVLRRFGFDTIMAIDTDGECDIFWPACIDV